MNCKALLTLVLTCLATAACNQDPVPAEAEDAEVGTLNLALTGIDGAMQRYRLRNATFQIAGTSFLDSQYYVTTVSSEDELDDDLLTTRLFPGSYSLTLTNEDWYLERMTESGPERVEQAALLSSRTQYVYIALDSRTEAYFQFGADGTLLDFRHGDLAIGIAVERPAQDAGAP